MDYDFDNPPCSPIDWCSQWFAQAEETDLPNPMSMGLSTVDEEGRPSSRIVLLKGFDERGAVFFTNANSQKGRQIAGNRAVALLFHWDTQFRQLRIQGIAQVISDEESDHYFSTRPRGSQISAWASAQSETVASRKELEQAWHDAETKFDGQQVTRPPFWVGYRVSLDRIEFWQGQDNRYHDRLSFIRKDQDWVVNRLYP